MFWWCCWSHRCRCRRRCRRRHHRSYSYILTVHTKSSGEVLWICVQLIHIKFQAAKWIRLATGVNYEYMSLLLTANRLHAREFSISYSSSGIHHQRMICRLLSFCNKRPTHSFVIHSMVLFVPQFPICNIQIVGAINWFAWISCMLGISSRILRIVEQFDFMLQLLLWIKVCSI